jgi:hypothetical protein
VRRKNDRAKTEHSRARLMQVMVHLHCHTHTYSYWVDGWRELVVGEGKARRGAWLPSGRVEPRFRHFFLWPNVEPLAAPQRRRNEASMARKTQARRRGFQRKRPFSLKTLCSVVSRACNA